MGKLLCTIIFDEEGKAYNTYGIQFFNGMPIEDISLNKSKVEHLLVNLDEYAMVFDLIEEIL